MKAIEALKQINEIFPEYIAIAKDKDGQVNIYTTLEISSDIYVDCWTYKFKYAHCRYLSENFASKIELDSYDWTKCIITINDLKNELN